MLDDMADAYEKKKEIEFLENSVSSEEKVYSAAIKRISENWNTLYSDLTNWVYNYGNITQNTLDETWNSACEAVQQYGSYLNAILETQRQIAEYEANSSSSSSYSYSIGGTSTNKNSNSAIGVTGQYDTSGKNSLAEFGSIISEMYRNMNEHGGSTSNTSKERKAELSQRNLDLGAQLRSKFNINAYRSTDANDYGTWYTSNANQELKSRNLEGILPYQTKLQVDKAMSLFF